MEEKLTPNPKPKFPAFPFEPYPIQIDFMNALYSALEKGGIVMLESPTGTGKTLSIICSALQWIVDQKANRHLNAKTAAKDSAEQSFTGDDEPDWMRNFSVAETTTTKKTKKLGFESGNSNKRCSYGNCGDPKSETCRKREEKKRNMEGVDDDEEGFLVEEYESGDEGTDGGDLKRKAGDGCFSSSDDDAEEEEEDQEDFKVYFCSRTHSQLSQFVKELKRTAFASEMKVVCLGSRKNFCINAEVLRLGNQMRINERCLELQKNKNQKDSKIKILGDGRRICRTKVSSGCPMFRKGNLQKQFRNEVCQSGALDMEDLVQLGKKIGTCPYYGSRSVVAAANLVILPYQSLLLKSARESLGLNLKKSIVIIDEAHNLADSLTNMYNANITLSQLEQVNSHLELYLDRFRNQLGAGNRRYIQILIVITRAFLRFLLGDDIGSVSSCHPEEAFGEKNVQDSSMAINDFLFSLNIDNINLVKLSRYIKESNIMHKVSGYGTKLASLQSALVLEDGGHNNPAGSSLSGFQALVDILLSLTNNDSDGRMIVSRRTPTGSRQQDEAYLKYVMLAGEKIFSEIADQAHAVVLAGGTLQPIEETRERLFPCLSPDRFYFFSCKHIVPPESILPIAVALGPSGNSFDFSYNSRSSPSMIEELGRLVCNLVGVVPEGIVMFFSSFEYESQVYDAWTASGILARILKKKKVFREPRSSLDLETVLKEYREAISLSNADLREDPGIHGALLLAVVGGKISEGINFSDGMGRCVIMVGLPYPSPYDVELMERVKYIEGLSELNLNRHAKLLGKETCTVDAIQTGFDIIRSCRGRGREYYENLCMKAVNQSIGRAIRHINDYAAILLVDSRYASNSSKGSLSHPTNKLPQWIKDSLISSPKNYGEVHRLLHQFYKFNRQRQYQ